MSSSTCASSIKITFKAEGCIDYTKDVTDLVLGNMVNPTTHAWEYGPIDMNPWTWNIEPNNQNAFALMANYTYKGGAAPKTAYSEVVIDPTQMGTGDHEVIVTLETAAILDSKENTILRFKSATLDGQESPLVSVKVYPDQSESTFYDC
jgi:hypothetical protein